MNIIEEFYRENFDKLVIQLSRRAGSIENAEDVVQEAFFRALKYQDSFNPRFNKLSTWFNKILKRCLYDFKRVEMRQGMAILEEEPLAEEATDLDGYEQKFAAEIEEHIAKKANVAHKNVLYLYFVRGYPRRDIVKITDESVKNIEIITYRFKQEMRDRYGDPRAEATS